TPFERLLLELMRYVPIAVIAGNLLPALGSVKIHWLYVGLVFVVTIIVLIRHKSINNLFLIIILFGFIQAFFGMKFSIIDYIDFISGPLLFIAVVNLVTSGHIARA